MVFPLLTSGCDGEQLFLQLLLPAAHLPQLRLKNPTFFSCRYLSPFLAIQTWYPSASLARRTSSFSLLSVSIATLRVFQHGSPSVLSVKYHMYYMCSISCLPVPAWLWFSLQEQKLLPQPSPSHHQPPPSPNAGKISNWKYCGYYICWWWTGTNQKIRHGWWKLFSSPSTVAAWSCLAPSASPSPPPPASPL